MMAPDACYEKSDLCELRATESPEGSIRAGWLEMAKHWRLLGDDGNAQSTMARLMQGPNI